MAGVLDPSESVDGDAHQCSLAKLRTEWVPESDSNAGYVKRILSMARHGGHLWTYQPFLHPSAGGNR